MTVERPALSPLRTWFSGSALAITVPLTLALAAFVWLMWPEWTSNPDLSHGVFAPIVFGLLIREGMLRGPQRWLPDSAWLRIGLVAALVGAVACLAMAGLIAASLGWSHSLTRFLLAAMLVSLLGGALFVCAGERVRAVPFNWTVLTAIGLWLVVAPLPPGTYARLTLELQSWVTSGVLNVLHLLGIPAYKSGNVIELTNTTVGVEEACSGIRSLVSCIYAGFFFAAWLLRRTWSRAFLIVIAPLIAVVMNYVRSLTLTLLANRGVEIAGFWHDATGFAILGVTALLLAVIANWLSAPSPASKTRRNHEEVREAAAPSERSSPPGSPHALPRAAVISFATGSSVLLALALFFALYQRPAPAATTIAFDADRLLPVQADGWTVITSDYVYQFSDILQTKHLAQRTYLRKRNDRTEQLTVYVAHWAPGQAAVSMVASHTPDACWPGVGWVLQPNPTPRLALELAGRALPPAEYRFFTRGPTQQHVWFWHIFDGRVISYRDPHSVPALLEIALRYGFRREGAQYFVRMSSNIPWEELASDPLLRQLRDNFTAIGLTP